jgi:hypothetical protein
MSIGTEKKTSLKLYWGLFLFYFYLFIIIFYTKYEIMYYVKSRWMKVTSINWLTITSGKQNYGVCLLCVTKNKIRKYIIIFWFPVFDNFT